MVKQARSGTKSVKATSSFSSIAGAWLSKLASGVADGVKSVFLFALPRLGIKNEGAAAVGVGAKTVVKKPAPPAPASVTKSCLKRQINRLHEEVSILRGDEDKRGQHAPPPPPESLAGAGKELLSALDALSKSQVQAQAPPPPPPPPPPPRRPALKAEDEDMKREQEVQKVNSKKRRVSWDPTQLKEEELEEERAAIGLAPPPPPPPPPRSSFPSLAFSAADLCRVALKHRASHASSFSSSSSSLQNEQHHQQQLHKFVFSSQDMRRVKLRRPFPPPPPPPPRTNATTTDTRPVVALSLAAQLAAAMEQRKAVMHPDTPDSHSKEARNDASPDEW